MIVSAIVPTWNRCQSLRPTLESLAQTAESGRDFEIIVVDNGSTDRTADVCAEIKARYPQCRWGYFFEPMPGLLAGRHRGAQESVGEICAFLDDDVRVSAGWLPAVRASFARPGVALAGGPSTALFGAAPPAWLDEFWTEDATGRLCTWLSLFDGGSEPKEIKPRFVLGLNFAIRRATLFELGGFHPDCMPASLQRFQGDGETGLSLELQARGRKAIYHPEMAVGHEVPAARMTAEYFERRAYYQGVCDSYTRIRAGDVDAAGWTWRSPLRRLKRLLKRSLIRNEASRIQELADRAYRAGERFHQAAVRADPTLREWVLRDSYLNYQLPVGWERFATKGEPR